MCTSAKLCIIAWWLLVIIAVLIWYRNHTYDRVMSGILFVIGLINLISYGCHSALKPRVAGNLVIISLLLLLVVITLGVYIHTYNSIALCVGIISLLLLCIVIFDIVTGDRGYTATVRSGCPEWGYTGSDILGGFALIFISCIIIAWICMLYHYDFADIGLYVIGIYTLFTLLYSSLFCEINQIGSMWCYLLTGLAVITWFIGIF